MLSFFDAKIAVSWRLILVFGPKTSVRIVVTEISDSYCREILRGKSRQNWKENGLCCVSDWSFSISPDGPGGMAQIPKSAEIGLYP